MYISPVIMASNKNVSSNAMGSTETVDKFKINRDAIQSVDKNCQALELQHLDISVYDQNILEQGIISQVDMALQACQKSVLDGFEEGETEGGSTRALQIELSKSLQPQQSGKVIPNSSLDIEKYLKRQAEFQHSKKMKMIKKERESSQENFEKSTKTRTQKRINLYSRKAKKNKKELLGSNLSYTNKERGDYVPGEKASADLSQSSDSEYIPSDDSYSSQENDILETKKVLKKKKPVKRKIQLTVGENQPLTSDSDWDSSDEELPKKRYGELDDGDVDAYRRRQRDLKQNIFEECHTVSDDYKCPLSIWERLYPYQREGVEWMWELQKQRCGGILGDEMGLGKTVQVIAFLAGIQSSRLVNSYSKYKGLGPTLVVCPTTVMHQWVREFHLWFPPLRIIILHKSGSYPGKDKRYLVQLVHEKKSGVLITSYSGLSRLKDTILLKQWHYVILDEGHKIRNPEAKVTLVAKELNTPHRFILSGSPLQNNLRELWSLFDFVYPGKLGSLNTFLATFAVPITQGGYANASETQVVTAYKCAITLKDLITPYLLIRMKAEVGASAELPKKTEQILFCKLTDEQRRVYKHYIENFNFDDMMKGKKKIFIALVALRKICNHPDLYSGGPNSTFALDTRESTNDVDRFGFYKRSGKMIVVETLLRLWKEQAHRVLLFTQGKKMLQLLEDLVRRAGYKYLKLDGSTSISARQPMIDKFNKDKSYFIMLLTTRVGGLGVNLTGADRVVIYDPDWNPATDVQARERSWRIGQKHDVTIYRLITAGTIEEKIYHRQVYKQILTKKVLSNPMQKRFFKSNDLAELFSLCETVEGGTTETAAIFAGTGSEVKFNDIISSQKVTSYAQEKTEIPLVTFSQSKIKEMMNLAQSLSKKIASNTLKSGSENNSELVADNSTMEFYGPDGKLNNNLISGAELSQKSGIKKGFGKGVGIIDGGGKTAQKLNSPKGETSTLPKSSQSTPFADSTPSSSSLSGRNSKYNAIKINKKSKIENGCFKKKIRKRTEKYVEFEGKTVPHLVKCKKIKKKRGEDCAVALSQDDYVLHKLFSKSGIETALRHDTVLGEGSDYALVEAEANRVAKEAVKSLQESRPKVARFQRPLKKIARSKATEGLESSNIFDNCKSNNLNLNASTEQKVLLKEVVSWLCSQGGTASTDQLVGHFSPRVGIGQNALFKSFLSSVAGFFRGPDNVGYWTIKEEFKHLRN